MQPEILQKSCVAESLMFPARPAAVGTETEQAESKYILFSLTIRFYLTGFFSSVFSHSLFDPNRMLHFNNTVFWQKKNSYFRFFKKFKSVVVGFHPF